jgi:hypothetical protein
VAPEFSVSENKVIRDVKLTIHLYLVSLELQRALSGDEVVRGMKLTIVLYLVSEGHQRALYLEMKCSGT